MSNMTKALIALLAAIGVVAAIVLAISIAACPA